MKVHGIQPFAQKEALPEVKRETLNEAKHILDSLREKRALLTTLEKEGLLNAFDPGEMKAQLAQIIPELEELIVQLEK